MNHEDAVERAHEEWMGLRSCFTDNHKIRDEFYEKDVLGDLTYVSDLELVINALIEDYENEVNLSESMFAFLDRHHIEWI